MSYVLPKDEGGQREGDANKPSPDTFGGTGASLENAANLKNGQKPKEKWSELDLQDRLIVLLTAGIFILTGLTAYIFLRQAHIMQGQLEEMKGSGQQTERLIILNTGQLIQTSKQVEQLGEQIKALNGLVANSGNMLANTRGQFRIEQRPYIWLAPGTNEKASVNFTIASLPSGKKQIVVTAHYTNFGKSPAVLIRDYKGIALNLDDGPFTKIKTWSNSKGILPSGKEDFFSVVSVPLNDEQVAKYLSVTGGIAFYTTWQYSDLAGHRYETDLCMGRLNLGAWAYCGDFNDIKDCSIERCEQ